MTRYWNLTSQFQRSVRPGSMWQRCSDVEAIVWSCGSGAMLCWSSSDFWSCQSHELLFLELYTGSGTIPREKTELQVANLEGQSDLSPLTSGMELQDLEFVLLGFGWSSFGLVFLAVSWFLPFGIAMYILCHCILEVYNFLFDFTIKRLPGVWEETRLKQC